MWSSSHLILDFGHNPEVIALLEGCDDLSLLDFCISSVDGNVTDVADSVNATIDSSDTRNFNNSESSNDNESAIIVKLNGMSFSGKLIIQEGSSMIIDATGNAIGLGSRRIRLLQYIPPNHN